LSNESLISNQQVAKAAVSSCGLVQCFRYRSGIATDVTLQAGRSSATEAPVTGMDAIGFHDASAVDCSPPRSPANAAPSSLRLARVGSPVDSLDARGASG